MKNNILLLLILSAAFSITDLSAADTVVDIENWAETRQIIYFNNDYPEYTITDSESLTDLPRLTLKPWTNQIRVAGFALVDVGVIIAVNSGYPLILNTGASGSATLSSPDGRMDRQFMEYSKGLTLGTIFSEEGSAFFHLYRDDFFNDSIQQKTGHPVLIELSKDSSGEYSLTSHNYDFTNENIGWEPVEYIRKNKSSLIAWKYTDEKKTRFRYIRHNENGESISEIDEGFFRDEYSLMPIKAGSFALRGFIRAARDGSVGVKLANAGDIYLRLSASSESVSEQGFPVYYHSPAPKQPAFSEQRLPVQLQACPDEDLWYILSDGEILVCGVNISRWKLPDLPDGFVYEELWVSGRDMIVSWEESRFTYIGRTGLMYIRLSDIFN